MARHSHQLTGLRFTRARRPRAVISTERSTIREGGATSRTKLGNATSVRYESEGPGRGPYASKLLRRARRRHPVLSTRRDHGRVPFLAGDAPEWTVLSLRNYRGTPAPLRDPATGELRVYAFDGKTTPPLTLFHADGPAGLRSPSTSVIVARPAVQGRRRWSPRRSRLLRGRSTTSAATWSKGALSKIAPAPGRRGRGGPVEGAAGPSGRSP